MPRKAKMQMSVLGDDDQIMPITMDSNGNIIWNQKKPNNMHPTGFGDEMYYHDDLGIRHWPPRTKYSHPYSYDPIVLIDTKEEGNGSAYSDRMASWDYDKFQKCLKGTGEMNFSWGNKKAVQDVAQAYYDDPDLKITKVVEMCNASSGYPVWLIVWKTTKQG